MYLREIVLLLTEKKTTLRTTDLDFQNLTFFHDMLELLKRYEHQNHMGFIKN